MCGIFAFIDINRGDVNLDVLDNMSHSLKHRGPDDCGYAFFELFGKQRVIESKTASKGIQTNNLEGVLAFGHRRLSIIDLTEAGHQPMHNENGQIWVILNGEIYNYQELTEELKEKGHHFRSRTDTEVILHAYEEWGIECLSHFNGMWAFALWDHKKRKLFCARDRFGIKPFYYYYDGKKLLLASEIKAILQDPTIERNSNDERVYDYLAYGILDHTEKTFFKNINQLRGSHYLTLEIKENKLVLDIRRYWDIESTEPELNEHYEHKFLDLFEDSVKLHMRSDVPLGTCLSGGLDSSSIVCVAKRFLNSNVHRTFSSCFEHKNYDEREFIYQVNETAGSEPHYIFPNPKDLLEEIEDLIWFQEEPFGSTSIYAQWNVFKLAQKRSIKVVLDGQGADELLAGYHPFFGYYLGELLKKRRIREFWYEYHNIKKSHGYSNGWLIRHIIHPLIPGYMFKAARIRILRNKQRWIHLPQDYSPEVKTVSKYGNILLDQLYNSLMNYSLPGLLHYEDRNSMAHSIEARVPFLDYRLVQFVFSLPSDQLIRDGTTKMVLREAMQGILPEKVRGRVDKMGFATPQDIWFRTTMKDYLYGIMESKSFIERPYFNLREVRHLLKGHCEDNMNYSSIIWRWLNLELWLRKFIDSVPRGHFKSIPKWERMQ